MASELAPPVRGEAAADPPAEDAERLRRAFSGVVRALGLLRPDTTPCGEAISVSEAHAIGELADGPLVHGELARRLRLEKSTVSRLVDQLEVRRIVRRTPHRTDRRRVLVSLTPSGRRRAARLAAARAELFGTLLSRLAPADRDAAIRGLVLLEEAADGP
jgi:DNA-binding MarR family transcriptional regulator